MGKQHKQINAHRDFVERIRLVERGLEDKFGVKWSDTRATKYLADNVDWDNVVNPLAERKGRRREQQWGLGILK